jgi:hypothetical protein
VANAIAVPATGDVPVSQKGPGRMGGCIRTYQCWYRNADPSFCTPSTFNLTNALEGLILDVHRQSTQARDATFAARTRSSRPPATRPHRRLDVHPARAVRAEHGSRRRSSTSTSAVSPGSSATTSAPRRAAAASAPIRLPRA